MLAARALSGTSAQTKMTLNQARSRQPPPRGATEQHLASAPLRGAAQALPLSFKSPKAQVGGFVWKQFLTLARQFKLSATSCSSGAAVYA